MKTTIKLSCMILAALLAACLLPQGTALPASGRPAAAVSVSAEETDPSGGETDPSGSETDPSGEEPELIDIGSCQVTVQGRYVYTGKKIKPSFSVECEGTALTESTDYTYSLKDNTNAGKGRIILTGAGLYTGKAEFTFVIAPARIKSVSGLKSAAHTGEPITQSPVVVSGGKVLTEDSDYTVSCRNNRRVGRAEVTVTGRGNYTGKLVRHFKILPRGTRIRGTDETAGTFTVKWKRQRSQTDGYLLRYSADRNFRSGVRTKKVEDNRLSSVTLKRPANASKIYIRIRTYKVRDGRNYYSAWSRVKATDGFLTAARGTRAAAKVKTAVLFKRPSPKSEHLLEIPFGARVTVRKVKGSWSYVKYSGGGVTCFGYMRAPHIVKYDKNKRHLALTFDDGPRAGTTNTVLNALAGYGFRATFFVVGSNISGSTRSLIQREKKLGCEIGNHSYSHPQLTNLSASDVAAQLSLTDSAVAGITGKKPALCRAPYGAVNDAVLTVMSRPNILWSVDTNDWKYRDTDRLISYVRNNKRDGAVILMHDIHPTTAAAVNSICRDLKASGYEAVTVTELAAIKGCQLSGARSYRSFY